MPPFAADGVGLDRSETSGVPARLTAGEVDLLLDWAMGGAPEGERPATGAAPESPVVVESAPADVESLKRLRRIDLPTSRTGRERRYAIVDFVLDLSMVQDVFSNRHGEDVEAIHLGDWRLHTRHPELLRAVELYRGVVEPGAFLGARISGILGGGLVWPEDTGITLRRDERLIARVHSTRPWNIGSLDPLVDGALLFATRDGPAPRRLLAREAALGRLEVAPGERLAGIFARTPLTLRSEGVDRLRVHRVESRWPIVYPVVQDLQPGALELASRPAFPVDRIVRAPAAELLPTTILLSAER